MIKIEVDTGRLLERNFTELERNNLPFSAVQASNAVAFQVRECWKVAARKVFDRPSPLTVNAAMYRKATRARPYAEVYLRDEAFKGNPPARYLLPQVEGGGRRRKGFEALLQARGVMPTRMFTVAGRGALLDQYGNVRGSVITTILSQLGAQRDRYQNQTSNSIARQRARRRTRRGGDYFALLQQHGRLRPGIYERIGTGFGSTVRSIFIFVDSAQYRRRYDIFGMAEKTWNKLMPFYFNRELAKAVQSTKFRGA